MTLDARGLPHVVWHHTRYEAPREDNFYYRGPDGRELRIGDGFGEFTWQPSIAITRRGEIIVARSSTTNYRCATAMGKVEYFVKTKDGFSRPHAADEDVTVATSWGSVAASGDAVMMVWSAAGRLRYALRPGR